MLGPPSSELIAGVQALLVAAALLGLGYLVADLIVGRRDLDEVDRWGLSLAGLSLLALILMGVHMATSGWLYSHPGLLRVLLVVVSVALVFVRVMRRPQSRGPLMAAAGMVLVAVAVWGSPVFRMMPLTATADTQLHNGWIDQLMAGETTPGATLTGDIPNYYPWLFHSIGAIATSITPGQTPFHALGALHLLLVAGMVLALFALGRALTGRTTTGVGTALLGALSGGFGFVMLRGVDVVTDPRGNDGMDALRYQGDMLFSRSYNLSFHNIVPPFPRDLAFGLLISFVLLLALRARHANASTEIAAGVVLGLVGLSGGETFIVGCALAVAVVAFDSERRLATAARLLAPALGIYALWFVPILVNYARLGGFVSITHIIPVDLPAIAIVVSWGLATPFALFGVLAYIGSVRQQRPIRLVALFVVVAGVMLMASAFIPTLVGDAFDTLGRKHRYWPIFYLSIALVGGFGFTVVFDTLRNSSALATAVASIVIFAVALASPTAASLATPDVVKPHEEMRAAMVREPDNLLHVLREAGPGCTVAAPQGVSRQVFAYTGYRMLSWTGNWLGENRARIRWAEIYNHITPEQTRLDDNALLTADPRSSEWHATAQRHGIDLVVLDGDARPPPELGAAAVTYGEDRYRVVQVDGCAPA